jgi:steroid delta-isomerase-like uncharacterized protein
MAKGCVISIHVAPAAGAPMESVESARAVAAEGLEGDRYLAKAGTFSGQPGTGRDVTLIESEAVDALNAAMKSAFTPGDMRRNIVTRGVALNHLVGREFQIGSARVRGIRLCEPCDVLESKTRPGVKSTMLHRCGLRGDIIGGGTIRVGDAVTLLGDPLEENKNLIRRFYDEMWNPWNFAKAEELLAPEIVFRGTLGSETRGREAFCNYMRRVQRAFPDFHNKIESMTAEDDRVVARMSYRATHRGEILGVAPAGKAITYAGAAFFRIEHSEVAEGWVLGDLLGLLRQLGARSLP